MFSYFKGATVFTIVCLGLAVWLVVRRRRSTPAVPPSPAA